MTNWIEQEEEKAKKKQNVSKEFSEHILEKEIKIKENYERNKEKFESFVSTLSNLVERVNNLSIRARWEFGKIDFKNKETKLDNKYHSLSCSIRISKRKHFLSFIPSFNKIKYKNVRMIFFYISQQNGYINFETKDSLLRKFRITTDGEREKIRKHKSKYNTHIHKNIYKLKIDDLSESIAFDIVDWLCFKKGIEALPFKNLGTKIK